MSTRPSLAMTSKTTTFNNRGEPCCVAGLAAVAGPNRSLGGAGRSLPDDFGGLAQCQVLSGGHLGPA
jgi:hypothetical protein